jgi:hypothetical protein
MRDHPLGEVDEMVMHRAVGDPGADRAEHSPAIAPNGQIERPQRDLDTQPAPAQDNRIGASSAGKRHQAKILPTPRDPMPTVTKSSQDVTSFFTNPALCRVILTP